MKNTNTLISHGNLFHYLRNPNPISRSLAMIVSVAMLSLYVSPAIAAAQGNEAAQQLRAELEEAKLGDTVEERFSTTLEQLQTKARVKHIRIGQRLQEEGGLLDDLLTFFGLSQLTLEEKSDLQGLEKRINGYHGEMLKSLQEQTQWMVDKKLPEIILERQRAKLADYQNQYQSLSDKLDAFYAAEDLTTQGAGAAQLNEFMQGQQIKQSNQPFDPNHLPWGSPDPKLTPPPANTKAELLSDSGISPFAQGIEVAALNSMPVLDQPNGPTASDLAENIEVQINDEIRAKAAELDHDPVKIYNWVRNNTEWLPTFGSIQGSQYTMDTMKGNAFDIASLLIALLRASNVPARYAYGSVDIPTEQMNNWVGGTKNADATQSLLGQGGIPNNGFVQGGEVQFIRINHIWVEAWVDYFPSRGAVHYEGDSWIPMDASYKQYEYKEGVDLQTAVPFDAGSFAQQLIASATIDEAAGTVQGIDQNLIETQLTDYQAKIQTYIDSLDPTTTVGDVLGEQKVLIQERMTLASGLPYKIVARTDSFNTLPDNLRYFYNLAVKKGGGNGKLNFTKPVEVMRGRFPLAQVANSFLALSFEPETADDEAALLALIPEPKEGEELKPEDFPSFLPGGVIAMKAQITVDGVVAKEIGNWRLGEEFTFSQNFEKPLGQYTHPADTIGVVGSYYAVGLGFGTPNPKKLNKLQQRLRETRDVLEQLKNNADIESLQMFSKHRVTGIILQTGVIGWFTKTTLESNLMAKNYKIVYQDLPSFGTFSTALTSVFSFGVIPKGVSIDGLMLDIQGSNYLREDVYNNKNKSVQFSRLRGMNASANEHQVPEDLLALEVGSVEGASAIKLIQTAMSQGQKIYRITKNNVDTLSEVSAGNYQEMSAAVAAGKEVIVHEKPVIGFGKITSGYIIIDPETGAGAYLISGGSNGGFIVAFILQALMIVLSIVALSAAAAPLAIAVAAGILFFQFFSFLKWVDDMENATTSDEFNEANIKAVIRSVLGGLAKVSSGSAKLTYWFGSRFTALLMLMV